MFRWRPLCTVTAILMVALCTPWVASAAEEFDPTVVVLDASGSMTATDVDGKQRMDAAKDAVNQFVDQVPAKAPLGLVTYGTGTGSSEAEKEAGCKDISVLARPGEKDAAGLKSTVNGLVPRGYTPIGNSLLKANELLPKEGARSIVLVSDGIDTCAPPPVCEVAKQLKQQGTDLIVHTIGFKVDEAARAELECVAQVTGGSYSDAGSTDSLANSLKRVTRRTGTEYQLPSEVVQFDAKKENAPTIEPGTLTDPKRINAKIVTEGAKASGGAKSYAKVRIPDGHRLQVGFNYVPPFGTKSYGAGQHFHLIPQLQTDKNQTCAARRTDVSSLTGGYPFAGALTSVVQGSSESCSADVYYLTMEAHDESQENLDMMLAVVPEPGANDMGDPVNEKEAPKRTESELKAAPAGQVQDVPPVTQWDDSAQEFTDTVESEIVEGETQYFAMPVEWGQSVDVTAEVVEDPGSSDAKAAETGQRKLELDIQNALGQSQSVVGNSTLHVTDVRKPQVFGLGYAVSFGNNHIEDILSGAPWLGGRYYVQVSFVSQGRNTDTNTTTQLQPLKYRLTATPVGTKVQGPKFADPAVQTKTSAAPAGTDQQSPQATDTNPMGISTLMRWALILGGVGVLALLVLIGWGLLRSRR